MSALDALARRVHLVGAGGAGMSALARLLYARGADVSGSDAVESGVLAELRDVGLEVWIGTRPERVRGERGTVVRSAAVAADHPEVRAGAAAGFEVLLYAEALGRLSARAHALAVAGSHGKTTTTAMVAAALRGGGIDASHIIGGDVPELGGSGRHGTSPWLVVEACEFDRSFLRLQPQAAAILNFDHDHFDCYPTEDALLDAYASFARRVPATGLLVVPTGAPRAVTGALACAVAEVGDDSCAELWPDRVEERFGLHSFVPCVRGRALPRVSLRIPGRFQVRNALCALALALHAEADAALACAGLQQFAGVRRRFEVQVGPGGGIVVDDYAHHPAEIAAVLAAARQRFPGQPLLAAFQPHQHQRTAALLRSFAGVLAGADRCLVADIYGARESTEVRASVCAADLVTAVRAHGAPCDLAGDVKDLPHRVVASYRRGDVVLMLGAGDIGQAVPHVVSQL